MRQLFDRLTSVHNSDLIGSLLANLIEIFRHPEYESIKHQELPGKPGTATWRWRRQGAIEVKYKPQM